MKKFLAALTAATLLFPSTTLAADNVSLTLEQAIGLALRNNRQIEQSAEDREAARWNLSAVRRSAGPVLNWSSTFNHIGGKYYSSARATHDNALFAKSQGLDVNMRLYPSYDNENSNTVALRMSLYTGGRLENQRESARYSLNVADLSLENSRQAVKYQAAAAYYQVLQNAQLVNVQEEALNLLQEHLRTVQIQYEVGTVAKSDMLAISVQLANTQQYLNTAQGNYQTAIAQLNNIIGLPIDTEIAASTKLEFNEYTNSEDDCLEYALNHRPDGIAANYAVKRAEADKNVAKAGYRPTVTAVARGDASGEGFLKSNHSSERWSVGLEVSWDIFDNGLTSARVHQAQAVERKAESVARQQLEMIQLEVHSAYIALKTAEKNIETTAAAVAKAEEEFEIAKVRYIEGVDTNLNVMNAQEKIVETRNNYYSALYTYNTSRAQLEKAMGIPVTIDALLYDEAVQSGKSANKSLTAAKVAEVNYLDDSAWELPAPFNNDDNR